MLGMLFCTALALGAAEERPTQAYAHALIAEMHIARGEWKAAEAALRYALVFDYGDRYLRHRLKAVLAHQGKRLKVATLGKRLEKTLRLPSRLSENIDDRPLDPAVAEH